MKITNELIDELIPDYQQIHIHKLVSIFGDKFNFLLDDLKEHKKKKKVIKNEITKIVSQKKYQLLKDETLELENQIKQKRITLEKYENDSHYLNDSLSELVYTQRFFKSNKIKSIMGVCKIQRNRNKIVKREGKKIEIIYKEIESEKKDTNLLKMEITKKINDLSYVKKLNKSINELGKEYMEIDNIYLKKAKIKTKEIIKTTDKTEITKPRKRSETVEKLLSIS